MDDQKDVVMRTSTILSQCGVTHIMHAHCVKCETFLSTESNFSGQMIFHLLAKCAHDMSLVP